MSVGQLILTTAVLGGIAGGMFLGLPADKSDEMGMDGEAAKEDKGVFVRLELLAIPRIREGEVEGYLLSRFVVDTDQEYAASVGPFLRYRVRDAINHALYARLGMIDEPNTYAVYQSIAQSLPQYINESKGRPAVRNVYIEQMDFLDKNEVRTPRDGLDVGS